MPKCTDDKLDFGRLGRRVIEADFSGGDLSTEVGALLLRSQRSGEPSGASLRELRTMAEHTIDQAANLSFVSPARWQQYEGGLRMPGHVDLLYKLQTGQHSTHELIRRGAPPDPQKESSPGGEETAK